MDVDLARLLGDNGMYASPPVSGSAHKRIAPGAAICATWFSEPFANFTKDAFGNFRSSNPKAPTTSLKNERIPLFHTTSRTQLIGTAAAFLIPSHAVPI